ncbi:MAG TPA: NUMOD3 domain-containing DNA-binding protein, partial [Candidatus Dojkabacteria bacterium]|nr:NUMOD3 domain-containing DNA-binding protein [Candidatus Dojkabacteria bacterium]
HRLAILGTKQSKTHRLNNKKAQRNPITQEKRLKSILKTLSTLESKKRRSSSQRKRFKNPLEIEKRTGKNNPFYGKHHSEETKEKIRQSSYHSRLKKRNFK